MKVSLIQMNAPDDKAANLARAKSLIAVPAGTVGQRAGRFLIREAIAAIYP